MSSVSNLESRISAIEKRNEEVELNKAWEGSWTRKLLVIAFTYISISIYLYFVVGIDPWINAIVPALGFLLSTLTLPYFKKWWGMRLYKKNGV
jgi:hypothetical protein